MAKPLAAHQQTLRAAKEAAAMFYGDAPDAAAKRINDRLAAISLPKINHPSLVKEIRGLAGGEAAASNSPDAGKLAEQFVDGLREGVNTEDDRPVLRCYQGDHYLWNGSCWHQQEETQFTARVMNYLQSLDLRKLNERLCRDVVAHLRGLALLDCWREPMPFLVVGEEPLEITRPTYVAFSNGILDLGTCIKGKGSPALYDHDSRFFNEVVLPYK